MGIEWLSEILKTFQLMKPFRFQQFSILQSAEVFRVGTDGVLLGVLSNIKDTRRVLEVGTGTGLISLMIAQRNSDAKILAIDINEKAVELAKSNFENSPFSDRLRVEQQNFTQFNTDEKFDLIVCNPPYFEKMEHSQKDILARQQITLNFEQLIENASKNLAENGIFSVIIPKISDDFFTEKCLDFRLKIQRRINIKGNANAEIKRCVLEFCKNPKPYTEEILILEKSPRQYSDEYLALTKDFHIFK